jgi:hypothetical protein
MKGKFWCEVCEYSTSRANDWAKHMATRKHRVEAAAKCYGAVCGCCGKQYGTRSGLWKHEKTCKDEAQSSEELMRSLIEELRATKDGGQMPARFGGNITINIFLNDRCGHALDFREFVRGLSVSLEDIATTRESGFIEGTSRILLNKLSVLNALERPIHCVDKKRLSFFVRDQDAWCRDDGERMTSAIGEVAQKQIARVKEWEASHPAWHDTDAGTDAYLSLVREVSGGASAEERDRNHREIARAVGEHLCIKDAMALAALA